MRYKITVFIAALVFTGAALMATRSSVRAQNNSNGNMQQGAIGNNLMRCDVNDEGCFSQQTPFPALGNPQLGLWSKNPGNKRQFTLTYYGQDFDDHFQLTDSYRVRGTVNLNASGTSFTGVLDITVYDLDGNEVFSDCCAAFEGSRGGLGSPSAHAAEYKPTSKGYVYLNRNQGWSRRSNKAQP